MILAFAETHRLAVQVLWGEHAKISSFTPENTVSSLCLYTYGDHAFFADDPHTKTTIAKMKSVTPQLRPETVLRAIAQSEDASSASERAEWTGSLTPRFFFADDLPARVARPRCVLHSSEWNWTDDVTAKS